MYFLTNVITSNKHFYLFSSEYHLQFRNPGAFEKNNELILIIIPTTPTMDVIYINILIARCGSASH